MTKILKNFHVLVVGIILMLAISCDSPMGMGDPIDFKPPTITLDAPVFGSSNPRYIRNDTVLEGNCFDENGVTKIICRDAVTQEEIPNYHVKINGSRWVMSFEFDNSYNGEKISVEIVAYDRFGNTGPESIVVVNLYIDTNPPVFSDPMIIRSPRNTANLERLDTLQTLASPPPAGDPLGENSSNSNRYQNGWFWINTKVQENETRIESDTLRMKIYSYENYETPDDFLIDRVRDVNSNIFSPQWLVSEDEIIAAAAKKGWDYDARLEDGEILFFAVSFEAMDRAGNKFKDDFGYFALNRKADKPKTRLSVSVENVEPGTVLPIEIFDDDLVETAYVDLMKKTDFLSIPGLTELDKLIEIKNRLLAGTDVKNYLGENIENRMIQPLNLHSFPLEAGKNESHYGEYIIIGITKDKKEAPHPNPDTYPAEWGYNAIPLNITDNNFPIIVIDTVDTTLPPGTGRDNYNQATHTGYDTIPGASTGNSPEENTFPKLTGGQYFDINGYTLRIRPDGIPVPTKITEIKMAWIPYGIANGQEANVEQVINAMKAQSQGESSVTPYPAGVQYWDLHTYAYSSGATSYFIEGTEQDIAGSKYIKQTFRKRFDILGGEDDRKAVYQNFRYNGQLENAPKLFVIYAKDSDGNSVTKTIRLLGENNPPIIKVYDFTIEDRIEVSDSFNAAITANQNTHYLAIRGMYSGSNAVSNVESYILPSFKTYPRRTTIALYSIVEETGGIGIMPDGIKMYDVTSGGAIPANIRGSNIGEYNDITYIEKLPDVTQRVFRFTATNKLGVTASMERTIVATTTSMLNEISTPLSSGTYGLAENDKPEGGIRLRAQFSGAVIVPASATKPLLRIRYETAPGTWKFAQVPLSDSSVGGTGALYLNFDFRIPEDANGRLETIDESTNTLGSGWTDKYPINLNGASILDAGSQMPVFLPGYNFSNWSGGVNSLQGTSVADKRGKQIVLDGKRPEITALSFSGKNPNPVTSNNYYFKNGETITFTIAASKEILTSGNGGNPRIQFILVDESNVQIAGTGTYYADFFRPNGTNGMIFTVDVNDINIPTSSQTGRIRITGFNTALGGVVDVVNNPLIIPQVWPSTINNLTNIRIDKKPPLPVHPELSRGASYDTVAQGTLKYHVSTMNLINTYNENPHLRITSIATDEPYGVDYQYSLDDGVSWRNSNEIHSDWVYDDAGRLRIKNTEPGQQWKLKVRQIDLAGNISVQSTSPQYIDAYTFNLQVDGTFARILSINAENSNGIYKTNSIITINLEFEDPIKTTGVTQDNRAYIIVSNVGTNSTQYNLEHTVRIFAQEQTQDNVNILQFVWGPITAKQMQQGLTITEINLFGNNSNPAVVDVYGNYGVRSTTPITHWSGNTPGNITMFLDQPGVQTETYTVNNLRGAGLIVDAIPPRVIRTEPHTAQNNPNNSPSYIMADNKTLKIHFSEPVRREQGMIAVRPLGDFPIPPVLDADEFYEIYNAIPINETGNIGGTFNLRGALISGTLNNPTLSLITGLGVGPYILNTQGLIQGPGYSGNSTVGSTSAAGWNPSGSFMVPDTRSKYVLAYDHGINDNTNTVNRIRAALQKAKYRWREVDVQDEDAVKITTYPDPDNPSITRGLVTITFEPPLDEGFSWEIAYPYGTFTDNPAGNPVLASLSYPDDSSLWFWTSGAQTPVIRVQRRSMDYRSTPNRTFFDNASSWSNTITGTSPAIINTSFKGNVNFRVESETPDAVVKFITLRGQPSGTGAGAYGAVDMYWTGSTGLGGSATWASRHPDTPGTWVAPNIVTRAISNKHITGIIDGLPGISYPLVENGVNKTMDGVGNIWLLRSYNRDATKSDLDGLSNWTSAGFTTGTSGTISIAPGTGAEIRASKNYIVARAERAHPGVANEVSANGYEGVFVTVIALKSATASSPGKSFNTNDANNQKPVHIIGSDSTSISPRTAGFPLNLQPGDFRFVKLGTAGSAADLYWATTEIVTQALFRWGYFQNNADMFSGAYQMFGDVGNTISGGYGDLTYSYNQDVRN